jgi:hypothetical protein
MVRAKLDRKLAAGASPATLAREHGLKPDNLRRHRDRHLLYLFKPGPGGKIADLSGLRVLHIRTVIRRPAGGADLTKLDVKSHPGRTGNLTKPEIESPPGGPDDEK